MFRSVQIKDIIIAYEEVFNIIENFPKELVSPKPIISQKVYISYFNEFGEYITWYLGTTDLSAYIVKIDSNRVLSGLHFGGLTHKPASVLHDCGFTIGQQEYASAVEDFAIFNKSYLGTFGNTTSDWNIALSMSKIYIGADAVLKMNNPNFIGVHTTRDRLKKIIIWYFKYLCKTKLVLSVCKLHITYFLTEEEVFPYELYSLLQGYWIKDDVEVSIKHIKVKSSICKQISDTKLKIDKK